MSKGKSKSMRQSNSEEACLASASESKSEVARIRWQIEKEYEALENLKSGFAITARHDFINARMNTIERCREQLVPLVGENEATRMMCESCAKIANQT